VIIPQLSFPVPSASKYHSTFNYYCHSVIISASDTQSSRSIQRTQPRKNFAMRLSITPRRPGETTRPIATPASEPLAMNHSYPQVHLQRQARGAREVLLTAQQGSSDRSQVGTAWRSPAASVHLLYKNRRRAFVKSGVLYGPGMQPVLLNIEILTQHDHTSSIPTSQQTSSCATQRVPARPSNHTSPPESRRADPLLHHPLRSHPLICGLTPPSLYENNAESNTQEEEQFPTESYGHQPGSSSTVIARHAESNPRTGQNQISQSESDTQRPTSSSHSVYELPGSPVEYPQRPLSSLPRRLLLTADDATDVYQLTSSQSDLGQDSDGEQMALQGSVVFDRDHQLSVGPFQSPRAMSWWLDGAETDP
jgi:hypothetical protein